MLGRCAFDRWSIVISSSCVKLHNICIDYRLSNARKSDCVFEPEKNDVDANNNDDYPTVLTAQDGIWRPENWDIPDDSRRTATIADFAWNGWVRPTYR